MSETDTTDLKDRTTNFMHALAASEADAANISADRTGAGMMVHTWLPPSHVGNAQAVAAKYGFELYGEMQTELKAKDNQAAADAGRKRYRFETQEADR